MSSEPLLTISKSKILLFTDTERYSGASRFLNVIGEPVSRPEYVHIYKLTPYSLFAAVCIGLTPEEVIEGLDFYSRNVLQTKLKSFILQTCKHFGKTKLVFEKDKYFLQSVHEDVFSMLLLNEDVWNCRAVDILLSYTKNFQTLNTKQIVRDRLRFCKISHSRVIENGQSKVVTLYSLEIKKEKLEKLRETCLVLNSPLLEESLLSTKSSSAEFQRLRLLNAAMLRPYQKEALSRMFAGSRAASGLCVLPCGAGKTLLGIAAACALNRNAIVLATTGFSCLQWKQQFLQWTRLKFHEVISFTATDKEDVSLRPKNQPFVFITTYHMLTMTRRKSSLTEKMMKEICSREWGIMLLDEVHIAPAKMFRRVMSVVHAHTRLGLTATLVREDELTEDLYFLVGPKLYEANWMRLQKAGWLATVRCYEIWAPFQESFLKEYLATSDANEKGRRIALSTLNPTKFRIVEYLIRWHEKRGHTVMVFSDNLLALHKYARLLGRPVVCGRTGERERIAILERLKAPKENEEARTVFISRVGDTSIDLPNVNVIIQISSHFASRRQEAQRLGRVLRPKKGNADLNVFKDLDENTEFFNAVFYSVVTLDSSEMKYVKKRQSYLIDQGYSYHVVGEFKPDLKNSVLSNKTLENVLLAKIKKESTDNFTEDFDYFS